MLKNINKRRILIASLVSLVVFGFHMFFFFTGYRLGLGHYHEGILSFIYSSHTCPTDRDTTERIEKTFVIESEFDNQEIKIENLIKYPHSWLFNIKKVKDGDDSDISNFEYRVYTSDGKVTLTIKPILIDYSPNVLSSETTFSQEITRVCLGNFDVSYSTGTNYVSVYRQIEEEGRMKYVQEVLSAISTDQGVIQSEDFVVFKHDSDESADTEIIWTAEVYVEFDDSVKQEEKESYLKIVDEIVASLRIK